MAEIGKIWGKETTDLAKFNQVDTSTISKVYGIDWAGAYLPAGAILPMFGIGGAPSGWTVWNGVGNAALYKYIIGAGGSYAVDAYTTWTNFAVANYTAGGHAGLATYRFGNQSQYCGVSSEAGHQHPMTLPSPYYPRYEANVMIRCNADTPILPQYTKILKYGSGGWSGLVRTGPAADAHMMPHTVDGEGATASKALTITGTGQHTHGGHHGIRPAGGGQRAYFGAVTPTHTHTLTASITWNLYRKQFSHWYPGALEADGLPVGNFPGFIIMYDSLTPPPGFSLCNGSNGTPDTRDYFHGVPALDSAAGTSVGDGKLYLTGTSSSDGGHEHWDGGGRCNSCPWDFSRHLPVEGAHTHNCVTTGVTHKPPYYALAFMMYTG